MYRRLLLVSILTAPLVGCAQPAETFADCVSALRQELPAFSKLDLKPETFDAYTLHAQDLRPIIDNATKSQPEFQVPIWDYLARRTDEQRIAQGRDLMTGESAALESIANRQGVDAATTVAVFGVETDYGRVKGSFPVIDV